MSTPRELYPGYEARTFRVRCFDGKGGLASVLSAASELLAEVGDVRIVRAEPGAAIVRDVTLYFRGGVELEVLCGRIRAAAGVELVEILNDALEVRRGGVVETKLRVPLESMRICVASTRQESPSRASSSRAHPSAPTTTPTSATGSPSSPTAPPSSAWATSAPLPGYR